LEPKITSLAKELSTAALEKGVIEFVGDISAPYNAAILGTMFGVPEADFVTLRHWLDDFFLREPAPEGQEAPQTIAMRYLREYLGALADERAKHQQDDLMTAMLNAEEDGQRLELEQVIVTTMTFLTAGFESTNNLFTNMAYALALHPGVLAELKTNPELFTNFVEEGMRWDAAAQGFVRTPTHDVELHGVTIPENTQVLLHIGAANRDERVFADPDTFDLHRQNNNHLGLGGGIHFCVGAPLGRLMTHTIFTTLIAASRAWEIDLSNSRRVTTPNFRGFAQLPLTIARKG
jgi:cytochrome P450